MEHISFLNCCTYLPGINFAISAHLLPWILWASINTNSSVSFHGFFLTIGSKWLCHLNRTNIELTSYGSLPFSALFSISFWILNLLFQHICYQCPFLCSILLYHVGDYIILLIKSENGRILLHLSKDASLLSTTA
jgi:hypothetical protein